MIFLTNLIVDSRPCEDYDYGYGYGDGYGRGYGYTSHIQHMAPFQGEALCMHLIIKINSFSFIELSVLKGKVFLKVTHCCVHR